MLLKPLQCIEKIRSFNQNILPNNFNNIPNPAQYHAEINLSIQLLEITYVGVSKLCCGNCHEILTGANIPHRGSHGVIDDGFIIPLLLQQLLNADIFEIHRMPQQEYDLSDDEELQSAQINFINNESINTIKQQPPIIGQHLAAGTLIIEEEFA